MAIDRADQQGRTMLHLRSMSMGSWRTPPTGAHAHGEHLRQEPPQVKQRGVRGVDARRAHGGGAGARHGRRHARSHACIDRQPGSPAAVRATSRAAGAAAAATRARRHPAAPATRTPSPPHNARRFRRLRVLLRHDNDGRPVVEVVDCARPPSAATRS